jgi:hypothetical protein
LLETMIGSASFAVKARSAYYGNGCLSAMRDTVTIDPYVIDSLMPDLVGHDRQPSAFLVYLLLWRSTHGRKGDRGDGKASKSAQIALTDLAELSGLSKRAVQDALSWLVKRRLLAVERASITAIPVYTVLRPWRRG